MIKAIVDRFKENNVVLILADGQRLNWPKRDLPANIQKGFVVWLKIDRQKESHKEILNEILKVRE